MKAREVLAQCQGLNIYQERRISENYAEVVIFSKDILLWAEIFDRIFGQPSSPAGIKPSEEDQRVTKDYGGVGANGTLYKKDFEGYSVLAMFWPWQDSSHTTLKIIVVEK